ncbi:MAG: cupin domain-containing protein [Streptosporangiaceae bacterium]|jgi:quercetin dioxygenase-like cupin family protein
MREITGAGGYSAPEAADHNHWIEHFRVPDLSVGTYSIPRGGIDDQTPHSEDEIYVVTSGQARLESGGDSVRVGPGSVVYVAAGEVHRFTDVAEDLAALVIFAPAYQTRGARDR